MGSNHGRVFLKALSPETSRNRWSPPGSSYSFLSSVGVVMVYGLFVYGLTKSGELMPIISSKTLSIYQLFPLLVSLRDPNDTLFRLWEVSYSN